MCAEEWRPVHGYEDHYEVSSTGRVRRTRAGRGATAGRVLRQHDQGGYLAVQLCRFDVKRKVGVHILVAEAFHGPRPEGKLPNHKNLLKDDNRADNLEWVTPKENAQHALAAGRKGGRSMPGEGNGRAKLTAAQVDLIRRLRGRLGQRRLAALCGVSKTAVQLIQQGKHWRSPEDLRVREFPGGAA
jgi:hypothetical protein